MERTIESYEAAEEMRRQNERLREALEEWAYQYPDHSLLSEYGDLLAQVVCPLCAENNPVPVVMKDGKPWHVLPGSVNMPCLRK